MLKRNYLLLLAGQFLGAFADNAILAVILGQLTFEQKAGQITAAELSSYNAIYTTVYFVPYVLLAPLAGFLNDRYPKTRWLQGGNALKFLGTLVATASVWLGPLWQGLGYLAVGVGACVYSPAKYGILPEVVERERLVKANGMMELLTLLATLTGFVGGAKMIDNIPVLTCYGVLLTLYGLSVALNLFMTNTCAHPGVKLGATMNEFFGHFRDLLTNRRLFRVLCGTGMLWFASAGLKMNFQPWGLGVLGLKDNTAIAYLALWTSIGVMIGAVLAGRWHRVGDLTWTRRYGWSLATLLGCLGLVERMIAAEWIRGMFPVCALLLFTGLVAGLFVIPLNAALQDESDPGKVGKTIAIQNFVDNMAMVAAGSCIWLAAKAGVGSSGVFLVLAISTALIVTGLKVPFKPLSSSTQGAAIGAAKCAAAPPHQSAA